MSGVLPVVGVVMAGAASFAPVLGALLPRLGPTLFHRLTLLRSLLVAAAVGLTLPAALRRPSGGRLAAAMGLLAGLTYLLHPRRIFVALDQPPHVAAAAAALGDEALVLGVEVDGTACAWPLELVIPHHLVNDRVGRTPVLVSY